MNTNTPSLVVSETDKARFVQLSAVYGEERDSSTVITQARFHIDGVTTLQRLRNDRDPAEFELSVSEMEALTACWMARKSDLQAKAAAEHERQTEMIHAAHELARQTGITITPVFALDDCEQLVGWKVEKGHYQTEVPTSNPDLLLGTVRDLPAYLG